MDFQVGMKRKHLPEMNVDEEDLISRMHRLVGDRWALIAGRIPGRTPKEIEAYWKFKRQKNKEAAYEAPFLPSKKQETSSENEWIPVDNE